MRRIPRLAAAAALLLLLLPAAPLLSQSRPARSAPTHREFEFWSSSRGGHGTSLNGWNRIDRRWHQIWVDDSGPFLVLEGGLEGDRMALSGVLPSRGDSTRDAHQRISWTPLPGGKVPQLWEALVNGGRTWVQSVRWDV